jgi:hypothetical protein
MADAPSKPHRPGEPDPQAREAERATNMANLARRIAKPDPARHIILPNTRHTILAEHHGSGFTVGLAGNKENAEILLDAKIPRICEEFDARAVTRRNKAQDIGHLIFRDTIEWVNKRHQETVDDPLGEGRTQSATDKILTTLAGSRAGTFIPVHFLGDHFITAEEAVLAARKELGKETLRIEERYLARLKDSLHAISLKTSVSNEEIRILSQWGEVQNDLKPEPDLLAPHPRNYLVSRAFMDFANILTHAPQTGKKSDGKGRKGGKAGARELSRDEFFTKMATELASSETDDMLDVLFSGGKKTGKEKRKEKEALIKEYATEMAVLHKHFGRQRMGGDTDARYVAAMLKEWVPGDRSLFIAGAAHAIYHTPTGLPHQLHTQLKDRGHGDAGIEVILPVDKSSAALFHGLFAKGIEQKILRPDIIVYDMASNTDYTVQTWLEKASQLYNDAKLKYTSRPDPK